MLLRGPLNHPMATAPEPQNKTACLAARGGSSKPMDEHRATARRNAGRSAGHAVEKPSR